MTDRSIDGRAMTDALLSAYLLDMCSEAEKEQVERQLFADDQVFATLRELEDDLVARYLHNQLPGPEREAFEAAYSSPHRRERVRFARALDRVLAGDTVQPIAPASRSSSGAVQSHESAPPAWGRAARRFDARFALAAAALFIVGMAAGWAVEQRSARASLARLEAENRSLREQRGADRQPFDGLPQPDARTGSGTGTGASTGAGTGANTPSATGSGVLATFVLSPGLVRSGRTPDRVTVAAGAAAVRLQLDLDPGIDVSRCRGELRDADGRVVWTQDGLAAAAVPGGRAVVVTVPAASLKSGEHELVLLAGRSAGSEDLGHYYFDVAKP
jgi:hypothetical protein